MKKARFNTLESKGPLFPEEYEVKSIFSVKNTKLNSLAEEMLWSAARYIENEEYFTKLVSTGNFIKCVIDAQNELKQYSFPEDYIVTLKEMKKIQDSIKEEKKTVTKEEKLKTKELKEKLKSEYGVVMLNGKPAEIGGFMIEAPSLIITRGKDPRFGNWKYRVTKKDVTLNIVGNDKLSEQFRKEGYNVISDPTAIWVYSYSIKCGLEKSKTFKKLDKRICFASTTSVWQDTRATKFNKTSNIQSNWNDIQQKIKEGCIKGDKEALIIFLIQETGIRIGGERNEKLQALTYGMQTLEGQHLKTIAPNKVEFDFLGKDSVRDHRIIEIDSDIWKILNALSKIKNQKIFGDNLNVNGYLKKIQPGANVKQLRTTVCNLILINELKKKKVTKESTEAEKMRALFETNLEIAKTLNHQKNVSKNQKVGEEKSAERVTKSKERIKILKEKHKEKISKLNEQAKKFKEILKGTKLLKEKLEKIEEQKVKLTAQMERAIIAAEKAEFNLDKKKLTAEISLGTSLANYADPKVLYSYLKSIDLPIEKIYTPGARKAFQFAEAVNEDYWRNYPN